MRLNILSCVPGKTSDSGKPEEDGRTSPAEWAERTHGEVKNPSFCQITSILPRIFV